VSLIYRFFVTFLKKGAVMSEDLRITKTKKVIKQAFIEEVKEKGFIHVNVKDITTKAMINRNTFYLHYTSKDDLVEQLVKDVIFSQSEQFFSILAKMKRDIYSLKEIVFELCAKSLLLTLDEEEEFYRVIITDQALRGYISRLSRTLKAGLKRVLHLRNEKETIVFEYMFSGLFGIIEYRLANPEMDIDITSRILGRCIYNAISQIAQMRENND
jgi:AcrR family transcriptional regulator